MFGWYGNFALISLFIILVLGFMARTNNIQKSFAFSSLLTALATVMFRSIGLVNDYAVLVAWIITGIMVAISFMFSD